MKRYITPISAILLVLVAVPERVESAVRVSTSIVADSSDTEGWGSSLILGGSPTEYRGSTASSFYEWIGSEWLQVHFGYNGWALSTQTYHHFGNPFVRENAQVQTYHFYQRKTCGFWEEWAERFTQQTGPGTATN